MSDMKSRMNLKLEQERLILEQFSGLAEYSLIQRLKHEGRKGRIYMLTTHRCGVYAFSGSALSTDDAAGNTMVAGLDGFLASASKEPDCLGFVPLSRFAQKALEARGMHESMRGMVLEPQKFCAVLYR